MAGAYCLALPCIYMICLRNSTVTDMPMQVMIDCRIVSIDTQHIFIIYITYLKIRNIRITWDYHSIPVVFTASSIAPTSPKTHSLLNRLGNLSPLAYLITFTLVSTLEPHWMQMINTKRVFML